jgi:hypothetical protein
LQTASNKKPKIDRITFAIVQVRLLGGSKALRSLQGHLCRRHAGAAEFPTPARRPANCELDCSQFE